MADFRDKTRAVTPPMLGGPGHFEPQRLAGTGTTESSNPRKLMRDRIHELTVYGTPGTNDVRVVFGIEGGLSDQVSTTDFVVPAGTTYPFLAVEGTGFGSTFVYVEAANGTDTYECFLVQRGR